jgi:nicotinamidase-related amidase
VIDVQRGLFNKSTPIYQSESLLANIQLLIDSAKSAGAMVVYVQHSAEQHLVMGTEDWQLHAQLNPQPDDRQVHKRHSSSFEGTALGEELAARMVGRLVVCGLVTHGCVKATSLDALRLGYRVVVAQDAHSSYSPKAAQLISEWNARLGQAGAEVYPAAEITFRESE